MIEIDVRRKPSLSTCTLGELFVDGRFQCYTLEDLVREVPGEPVEAWKIKRETAIPAGRYAVVITRSKRFGRDLPLLVNVPGFDAIRIHSGNTDADTEGCILVGTKIAGESITESRRAFDSLFVVLRRAMDCGEQVWLSVTNPQVRA